MCYHRNKKEVEIFDTMKDLTQLLIIKNVGEIN